MENTALIELKEAQMMEICGGGFAYDVGRVLRFLSLCSYTTLPGYAVTDWQVNKIINDAVNDPPPQ